MAIVLDCGTHVTCLQHDCTITGCSGLAIEGLGEFSKSNRGDSGRCYKAGGAQVTVQLG